MRVYVITASRDKVHSVHWSEAAAKRHLTLNCSDYEKREMHAVDITFDERDGSYFSALAKTTAMADIALKIVAELSNSNRSTFQALANVEHLCAQLKTIAGSLAK